jgi:hypothetical protein
MNHATGNIWRNLGAERNDYFVNPLELIKVINNKW